MLVATLSVNRMEPSKGGSVTRVFHELMGSSSGEYRMRMELNVVPCNLSWMAPFDRRSTLLMEMGLTAVGRSVRPSALA